MTDTLRFRLRRTLTVDAAAHPRGAAFVGAASGLVRVGPWLCVVADDEHHLGIFAADSSGDAVPLKLLRLIEGDLPAGRTERKKRKPDFEALLALPTDRSQRQAALLALGSGSRPNRQSAVFVSLDEDGGLAAPPRRVDLAPLYGVVAERIGSLNIEGAFVIADELRLLHRGNGSGAANAIVAVDLDEFVRWLAGAAQAVPRVRSIRRLDLGRLGDAAFGFTDGAALPDGSWLFSAVAEATDDAYEDGPCAGALIGLARADDTIVRLLAVEPALKIEGLVAEVQGNELVVLAVTDADDPAIASRLMEARMAWPPNL